MHREKCKHVRIFQQNSISVGYLAVSVVLLLLFLSYSNVSLAISNVLLFVCCGFCWCYYYLCLYFSTFLFVIVSILSSSVFGEFLYLIFCCYLKRLVLETKKKEEKIKRQTIVCTQKLLLVFEFFFIFIPLLLSCAYTIF